MERGEQGGDEQKTMEMKMVTKTRTNRFGYQLDLASSAPETQKKTTSIQNEHYSIKR